MMTNMAMRHGMLSEISANKKEYLFQSVNVMEGFHEKQKSRQDSAKGDNFTIGQKLYSNTKQSWSITKNKFIPNKENQIIEENIHWIGKIANKPLRKRSKVKYNAGNKTGIRVKPKSYRKYTCTHAMGSCLFDNLGTKPVFERNFTNYMKPLSKSCTNMKHANFSFNCSLNRIDDQSNPLPREDMTQNKFANMTQTESILNGKCDLFCNSISEQLEILPKTHEQKTAAVNAEYGNDFKYMAAEDFLRTPFLMNYWKSTPNFCNMQKHSQRCFIHKCYKTSIQPPVNHSAKQHNQGNTSEASHKQFSYGTASSLTSTQQERKSQILTNSSLSRIDKSEQFGDGSISENKSGDMQLHLVDFYCEREPFDLIANFYYGETDRSNLVRWTGHSVVPDRNQIFLENLVDGDNKATQFPDDEILDESLQSNVKIITARSVLDSTQNMQSKDKNVDIQRDVTASGLLSQQSDTSMQNIYTKTLEKSESETLESFYNKNNSDVNTSIETISNLERMNADFEFANVNTDSEIVDIEENVKEESKLNEVEYARKKRSLEKDKLMETFRIEMEEKLKHERQTVHQLQEECKIAEHIIIEEKNKSKLLQKELERVKNVEEQKNDADEVISNLQEDIKKLQQEVVDNLQRRDSEKRDNEREAKILQKEKEELDKLLRTKEVEFDHLLAEQREAWLLLEQNTSEIKKLQLEKQQSDFDLRIKSGQIDDLQKSKNDEKLQMQQMLDTNMKHHADEKAQLFEEKEEFRKKSLFENQQLHQAQRQLQDLAQTLRDKQATEKDIEETLQKEKDELTKIHRNSVEMHKESQRAIEKMIKDKEEQMKELQSEIENQHRIDANNAKLLQEELIMKTSQYSDALKKQNALEEERQMMKELIEQLKEIIENEKKKQKDEDIKRKYDEERISAEEKFKHELEEGARKEAYSAQLEEIAVKHARIEKEQREEEEARKEAHNKEIIKAKEDAKKEVERVKREAEEQKRRRSERAIEKAKEEDRRKQEEENKRMLMEEAVKKSEEEAQRKIEEAIRKAEIATQMADEAMKKQAEEAKKRRQEEKMRHEADEARRQAELSRQQALVAKKSAEDLAKQTVDDYANKYAEEKTKLKKEEEERRKEEEAWRIVNEEEEARKEAYSAQLEEMAAKHARIEKEQHEEEEARKEAHEKEIIKAKEDAKEEIETVKKEAEEQKRRRSDERAMEKAKEEARRKQEDENKRMHMEEAVKKSEEEAQKKIEEAIRKAEIATQKADEAMKKQSEEAKKRRQEQKMRQEADEARRQAELSRQQALLAKKSAEDLAKQTVDDYANKYAEEKSKLKQEEEERRKEEEAWRIANEEAKQQTEAALMRAEEATRLAEEAIQKHLEEQSNKLLEEQQGNTTNDTERIEETKGIKSNSEEESTRTLLDKFREEKNNKQESEDMQKFDDNAEVNAADPDKLHHRQINEKEYPKRRRRNNRDSDTNYESITSQSIEPPKPKPRRISRRSATESIAEVVPFKSERSHKARSIEDEGDSRIWFNERSIIGKIDTRGIGPGQRMSNIVRVASRMEGIRTSLLSLLRQKFLGSDSDSE